MFEISDITIIIVTFKSSHLIQSCIKNITNKGAKIIIVDNGSEDDIEQNLKENLVKNSNVELIALENNCGLGKANNVALKK